MVTKFGRHNPPDAGHVIVECRRGLYSRGRKKRVTVKQRNGRWFGSDGKDYTADIERIEREKVIKKLGALCQAERC